MKISIFKYFRRNFCKCSLSININILINRNMRYIHVKISFLFFLNFAWPHHQPASAIEHELAISPQSLYARYTPLRLYVDYSVKLTKRFLTNRCRPWPICHCYCFCFVQTCAISINLPSIHNKHMLCFFFCFYITV